VSGGSRARPLRRSGSSARVPLVAMLAQRAGPVVCAAARHPRRAGARRGSGRPGRPDRQGGTADRVRGWAHRTCPRSSAARRRMLAVRLRQLPEETPMTVHHACGRCGHRSSAGQLRRDLYLAQRTIGEFQALRRGRLGKRHGCPASDQRSRVLRSVDDSATHSHHRQRSRHIVIDCRRIDACTSGSSGASVVGDMQFDVGTVGGYLGRLEVDREAVRSVLINRAGPAGGDLDLILVDGCVDDHVDG
jgi:hypothetical protein